MTVELQERFKIRGGLKAALVALNEVPLRRELIVELDNLFTTGEFDAKIGDGTAHYVDLPYLQTGGGGSSVVGTLNGLNDQTGTSYTISPTDNGYDVRCTNTAAISLNIDTQANVPVADNFWCLVSQGGVGLVTVTALSGVTLRSPNGASTSIKYDARGIERIVGDEWRVW